MLVTFIWTILKINRRTSQITFELIVEVDPSESGHSFRVCPYPGSRAKLRDQPVSQLRCLDRRSGGGSEVTGRRYAEVTVRWDRERQKVRDNEAAVDWRS